MGIMKAVTKAMNSATKRAIKKAPHKLAKYQAKTARLKVKAGQSAAKHAIREFGSIVKTQIAADAIKRPSVDYSGTAKWLAGISGNPGSNGAEGKNQKGSLTELGG